MKQTLISNGASRRRRREHRPFVSPPRSPHEPQGVRTWHIVAALLGWLIVLWSLTALVTEPLPPRGAPVQAP